MARSIDHEKERTFQRTSSATSQRNRDRFRYSSGPHRAGSQSPFLVFRAAVVSPPGNRDNRWVPSGGNLQGEMEAVSHGVPIQRRQGPAGQRPARLPEDQRGGHQLPVPARPLSGV